MAPVPVALWRRGHGSNGDLTLLFLAPVFSYLPQAALGALIFVAAVGLVDLSSLRHIFSVERRDGVLAIIAALAVIATGALYGIVGAV